MVVQHTAVMSTADYVFAVRTRDETPIRAEPWGPEHNTLVDLDAEALALGQFTIRTGNGFADAQVTTRIWDAPPGEPSLEWEDVVEVSLSVTSSVVLTDPVESEPAVPLLQVPGRYRLRVSARGRVLESDSDDHSAIDEQEEPVEFYLLEAWPAAPVPPTVLRADSVFSRHNDDSPRALRVPETDEGIAAAARIGRDIDRAIGFRELSGAVGTVHVRRAVPGTRRRLFSAMAHATSFSSHVAPESSWTWSGPWSEELGQEMYASSVDHADQLTGRTGTIRYSFAEVDRPRRAVRRWNWLVAPRPGAPWEQWKPLLAADSVLTITLEEARDATGDAQTEIVIEHDGLPLEWIDDMTAWWDLQLAIVDHARLGVPKA